MAELTNGMRYRFALLCRFAWSAFKNRRLWRLIVAWMSHRLKLTRETGKKLSSRIAKASERRNMTPVEFLTGVTHVP
jgi:hypothetical protein